MSIALLSGDATVLLDAPVGPLGPPKSISVDVGKRYELFTDNPVVMFDRGVAAQGNGVPVVPQRPTRFRAKTSQVWFSATVGVTLVALLEVVDE